MTFQIEWSIKASDWEVARTASLRHHRGSEYDRGMVGIETMLPAHIRFLHDGMPLSVFPLGENDWLPFFGVRRKGASVQTDPAKSELISGWGVWMFEFATALALMFVEDPRRVSNSQTTLFEAAQLGTIFRIHDADSPQMIIFRKANATVEIATSGVWTWSWMARVPIDEFVAGCHWFLREFTAALETNAPALLDWESLKPLLAFSGIQDC